MNRKIIALALIFSILALVAPALAQDAKLRILHINDFHGFAEPYRPLGRVALQGGAAYLAYEVKKLRQERPSLFLAAGDLIQGDNFANLFEGASVMELLKTMGLDAMVVGNHENRTSSPSARIWLLDGGPALWFAAPTREVSEFCRSTNQETRR